MGRSASQGGTWVTADHAVGVAIHLLSLFGGDTIVIGEDTDPGGSRWTDKQVHIIGEIAHLASPR